MAQIVPLTMASLRTQQEGASFVKLPANYVSLLVPGPHFLHRERPIFGKRTDGDRLSTGSIGAAARNPSLQRLISVTNLTDSYISANYTHFPVLLVRSGGCERAA